MRLIALVCFAVVGLASALPHSEFVSPVFNYHENIGFAEAKRILAAETLMRANEDNRIVGGVVSALNAHPFLAGLVINFVNIAGQSACGSSLLSANRLITAAHCWFDGGNQASQFTVVLGSQYLFSGGTRIPTSTVIMHSGWNPFTLLNDVAMIYLPYNVVFSTSIQPIALPTPWDLQEPFTGEWGIAAGYGKTNDAQVGVTTATLVSEVNLRVITLAQCQASFGVWAQASNICTDGAGGVGICGGDSGGPLFINRNGQRTLVGVSSFVASAGCQLGFPSAFARVTSFFTFITSHL